MAIEPQLSTGDEIAGYTLESLVGRGGMGEVFMRTGCRSPLENRWQTAGGAPACRHQAFAPPFTAL